jgi:hypothetical protein
MLHTSCGLTMLNLSPSTPPLTGNLGVVRGRNPRDDKRSTRFLKSKSVWFTM